MKNILSKMPWILYKIHKLLAGNHEFSTLHIREMSPDPISRRIVDQIRSWVCHIYSRSNPELVITTENTTLHANTFVIPNEL